MDEIYLRIYKLSFFALLLHLLIVFAILSMTFVMEYFPAYGNLYTYEITFIPFIDQFPVMILWLTALISSLVIGLYNGIKALKAGNKSIFFRVLNVIGWISATFWAFFIIAEIISPH